MSETRLAGMFEVRRGIALAMGALACYASVSVTTWVNADTNQFTSLALNTPAAVNFLGTADMIMTRTSAVGSPILLNTWCGTFAASADSGMKEASSRPIRPDSQRRHP